MKLLTAIECPGLSTGLPSLKRPMRGPRKMAATRAQVPPKKCTTPLPAMSMKPISFNQPSSAHAHRDTTGYTKPAVFISSYNFFRTKINKLFNERLFIITRSDVNNITSLQGKIYFYSCYLFSPLFC